MILAAQLRGAAGREKAPQALREFHCCYASLGARGGRSTGTSFRPVLLEEGVQRRRLLRRRHVGLQGLELDARLILATGDADVAVLTPVRTPAVLHQPVLLRLFARLID